MRLLPRALWTTSALVRAQSHGELCAVTCIGCVLAIILLCSELHQVLYAPPVNEMGASTERHALMDVDMDITFPRLPCASAPLPRTPTLHALQSRHLMRRVPTLPRYKDTLPLGPAVAAIAQEFMHSCTGMSECPSPPLPWPLECHHLQCLSLLKERELHARDRHGVQF